MVDLNSRTKAFALAIIKLSANTLRTMPSQILTKQLVRSGTSIGANYREASRARSNAEFTAKIGDCLKELEESVYWLELLCEAEFCPADTVNPIIAETRELTAIFTIIAKKAKSRL